MITIAKLQVAAENAAATIRNDLVYILETSNVPDDVDHALASLRVLNSLQHALLNAIEAELEL